MTIFKGGNKKMGNKKGLQVSKMAGRILNRSNNIYKKEVIIDILNAYMDECRKALIRGERVQLSGVGTIIPEVRTHRSCYLPYCNNDGHENSPYTRIRLTRTNSLREDMNKTLLNNIGDGTYGLEKLSFDVQQISNLKANGFIHGEETDYGERED